MSLQSQRKTCGYVLVYMPCMRSLLSSKCVNVYLWAKTSKTLFVWSSRSLWKPRTTSGTVQLCKPHNEALAVCCRLLNLWRTQPHRYNAQGGCTFTLTWIFLLASVASMKIDESVWIVISLTQQKTYQWMQKVKDCSQLPPISLSCTWTQEPDYCRWCCIYL